MNHTIAESKEFCSHSADMIKLAAEKGIDIGVAPSYLSLQTVKEIENLLKDKIKTQHPN